MLHLPAHMPVDGFWSLSIHQIEKTGAFFADNAIHRWSINPYTPGLRRNADGSLDIVIQRDRPEEKWVANWLPQPELLDRTFHYPAIERLD